MKLKNIVFIKKYFYDFPKSDYYKNFRGLFKLRLKKFLIALFDVCK